MSDAGQELKELAGLRDLGKVLADPIKGFGVLTSYGRKRLTGQAARGAQTLSKVHPEIRQFGKQFEDHAKDLTSAVYRILTKHGAKIKDKQFATKRLAMIMIDLFVFVSVISRVSQAIEEKGLPGTVQERQILEVFAGQVRGRIARNYNKIDYNDDELIKSLSDFACEKEAYIWDSI
jgi:uncharacterized membrane protein